MRRGAMIAALLIGGGCATASAPPSAREKADLAKALDGRIAGKPAECIPFDRLDGPDVIDDRTILYRESSRRIWRSDLPGSCPGLRGDPILVVERYGGGGLCRNDRFTVVDRIGGAPWGKCRFGPFTPYDRPGNGDHPR